MFKIVQNINGTPTPLMKKINQIKYVFIEKSNDYQLNIKLNDDSLISFKLDGIKLVNMSSTEYIYFKLEHSIST